MVNKVTLIGHLGRDPDLRRLPDGTAVANVSVATNETFKDREGQWREEVEWHDVVLWRRLAESAEQQLRKGMLVYVEGKLAYKTWQDKEGLTRKTVEVVVGSLRILKGREAQPNVDPRPERVPAEPGSGAKALADFTQGGVDL